MHSNNTSPVPIGQVSSAGALGAYQSILASVTDAFEREVFNFLAARAGQAVRREAIIKALCGRNVERARLAADPDDRRLRLAISSLQRRGAPILASAKSGGYLFAGDEAQLEDCIRELRSRQAKLDAKIRGLQRSREIAHAARTYPPRAQQNSLFGLGAYQRP